MNIILSDRLSGPWCLVKSAWTETRRVFRRKERHWKKKISRDGSWVVLLFYFVRTSLVSEAQRSTSSSGGGGFSLSKFEHRNPEGRKETEKSNSNCDRLW